MSKLETMVLPLEKERDAQRARADKFEAEISPPKQEAPDWKSKFLKLQADVEPMRKERDFLKQKNQELALQIAHLMEEAAHSSRIVHEIEIRKAKSPGGVAAPESPFGPLPD